MLPVFWLAPNRAVAFKITEKIVLYLRGESRKVMETLLIPVISQRQRSQEGK